MSLSKAKNRASRKFKCIVLAKDDREGLPQRYL
jgi:hypothetical protein